VASRMSEEKTEFVNVTVSVTRKGWSWWLVDSIMIMWLPVS
jgi:hypothetical protein